MTQTELIENQRRFLLIYAEKHGISEACKAFGVSRTTFYKLKEQFMKTGSLAPRIRRKPRMPNEISLSKKKLLLRFVQESPMRGPAFYAYCFRRQGLAVTSACLWYHLKRFGLNHRYRRLVYLETLKRENQPLTERTLKEARHKLAEIKRGLWPGHIVALDTFYVGHLKGVGRIYQLSGLDLCSRFGWARLYLSKEQRSAVDFVENHLLSKFFQNGVDLESVLSDNGSEFTGRQFETMLEEYEIQHHRIPPGKPVCNGYCERFQRTILEEFYQPVFRKRFFKDLPSLQESLDEYLVFYNFERVHFGIDSKGMTPIEMFKTKRAILQTRFKELLT